MNLEEFEREIKQRERQLKELGESNPQYQTVELELLKFRERYNLTQMSLSIDNRRYKK